jgi:predicted ester cyclase
MKTIQLLIIGTIPFFAVVHSGHGQEHLKNKYVAKRYFEEVVNRQNLSLLPEVFADPFRTNNLLDNTSTSKKLAEHTQFLQYLFRAFPDIHYTIGDIICESDKVFIRVGLSATHKNEFLGYEASGNRINHLSEIFVFRFEEGKIVESWYQLDLHNLFKLLAPVKIEDK